MATIDLRMQSRRDTAANWSSANPTLAEGEIGYVTDGGYYKIGDGATAWNLLATAYHQGQPISVGDFNISTTDETYDLGLLSVLDIGIERRVSWFNGDGSNTFSFTGTTETIDGIPFSEYTGQGTGYLNLRHLGSGSFETFDVDVWDRYNQTYDSVDYIQKKFVDGTTDRSGSILRNPSLTEAELWSILDPVITNVGDSISLAGGYNTASVTLSASRAIRDSATQISISGHVNGQVQTRTVTSTAGGSFPDGEEAIISWKSLSTRWTTSQPRRS